ncbi:MAG: hypothetical protein IJ455_04485 [Agathobacter sp.]|nr:hypothetical protein [Agathobacter sp.]
MKREKGSITIFSLISLLLITAALFAMLEGTRFQELQRFAKLQTKAALESVFANYNTCLWEKYHLLGTNETLMGEQVEKAADGRTGRGTNFLRLNTEKIATKSYTLITDGEGRVFIGSVAGYMRDNLLYETAKELYSQYDAIKHLMDSNQMDLSDIGTALKEIENTDVPSRTNSFETTATKEAAVDVEAILEAAKNWQKLGILELVIKDTEKLSNAEQDFSDGLLERTLKTGKNYVDTSIGWQERILLQQYLLTYLSSFQNVQEGRALAYELEYLIGQKPSDIENLKVVATRLLTIREAANFLYLLSNPEKMAQAEAAATLIAGASLNPVLLEVVKIGILTAWALAESILDVRALLAGKRIALLKSEETWTSELFNMSEITNGFGMAKESSWGLNYENYLGVLLLLENEQTLAMRTMSVQEATIRKTYQDVSFQMDLLLTQASVQISYSYQPVFPFLRMIDAEERWKYAVSATANYGYY